ncbi:hypothetical protein ACFPZ0_02475 [Streptomonospora nanhaiensis]|uniref:hypothetical protein n=1 Tax=Streptomonospora nanhaiensis TaxID=1323731 RepID=UPI001C391064|nr:hypothetical protein [Streptomonospora nanhaiensis]MBV2362573.1 hypothetical protein [Streptomonospora nanhaiensis]MBX9386853.1 hypothetical protein [Streptomonospora nanhaiensis]
MSPVHSTSRRSRGPLGLAAVAAAAVLGVSGCSIDLSHLRPGGGDEPSPSPTPVDAAPLLESALESLRGQPAVTVQGQVSATENSIVSDIALTTTAAGASYGTLQESENEAEVMAADSRIFVNAPEEYWLDQNVINPDTDSYADNWVRVSARQLGFDPGAVLAPAQLADIIGAMAPDGGRATLENLDGTTAYRVDLRGGEQNRVWIGEESGELLRAEIEQLAPEGAEDGPRSRLNFTPAEPADVESVYTDVLAVANDGLKGAPDSRLPVNWSGQLELNCETGGACTVSGTVKDDSEGDSGDSVVVRMDATVSNDELGSKECDDTGTLKAGGTVDLSCGVDFNLAPSASPQSYEVSGDAQLSTRALTGEAREEFVTTIEEQRDAALENPSGSPSASPSESAGD